MLGDNQGALSLAQGTVSATQNRAYDLLLFYQRELADQRKIKFIYISTSDNVADLMTKALPEETFLKHVKNLGMRNSCVRHRGACRHSQIQEAL